jgi:hypothetical protein
MRLQRGVHGWTPSPHAILIHPVIVDQKIRLKELDRATHRQRGSPIRMTLAHGVTHRDQHRAKPLATAEAQLAGCSEGPGYGQALTGVFSPGLVPDLLQGTIYSRTNVAQKRWEGLLVNHCRLA